VLFARYEIKENPKIPVSSIRFDLSIRVSSLARMKPFAKYDETFLVCVVEAIVHRKQLKKGAIWPE
jgi:hypothetical protein